MKRTTIYLPDDLKQALTKRAKLEGRSEADIIRRSLSKTLLVPPRKTARDMSFGMFSSGHTDTSERVDEILRESGFGES